MIVPLDLNAIIDDIMPNPINPKTKLNDDFHSDYEQLIKDSQAEFIIFNHGTNFIRKIKIIHTKISTIYLNVETIFPIVPFLMVPAFRTPETLASFASGQPSPSESKSN